MRIAPPGSVYFTAFVSRFVTRLDQPPLVADDDERGRLDVDLESMPALLEHRRHHSSPFDTICRT